MEGGEKGPLHIKDSRATPSKKISYRTHVVVERREGYNMYIGFQGLLEGLQHQGLVMLKRKMGAS